MSNLARRGVIVGTIAAGGALGALARYAVARAVPADTGQFPWSTFAVNVSGSAALGVLLTVVVERMRGHPLLRPALGTGVLGAFTTFSTMTVDTALLGRAGHVATAALYLVATVAAGLAALTAGMLATRAALGVHERHPDELVAHDVDLVDL